jgi:hypothetical protein
VPVDRALVGGQKQGILPVDLGLVSTAPEPLHAQPQHRPPAAQCHPHVARGAQQIRHAHSAKTGIGGGDEIAAGIGQRAVEIKDHGAHRAPLSCVFRQETA